jgi:hypothetical protein
MFFGLVKKKSKNAIDYTYCPPYNAAAYVQVRTFFSAFEAGKAP